MNAPQLIASFLFSKCAGIALSPLKLLPIKRKTALFLSFRGKQYSCNPRVVSEELKRLAGDEIEIIWAFHEPKRFEFLKNEGVKVISDRGLKFIVTALTSRVVCTNTYYKPYLPRRRGQFYLRTWHGGGAYKRVSYPKGLMGHYIRMQQEGADLYLSSSRAFTEMTLRQSFGYEGEVLEKGMPRNDPLVNGAWREIGEKVKAELGLSGKGLCLYAPTYREHDGKIPAVPDAESLRRALKERFGGEWVLAYRGHHAEKNEAQFKCDLDLSTYPDMQPLLMAADALVTDYSSSIWDMSLTFKPVFLFCPDIVAYKAERDFYTDINTWGFPVSQTDDELKQSILSFDPEKYKHDILKAQSDLGSAESGEAARLAAERIVRECG